MRSRRLRDTADLQQAIQGVLQLMFEDYNEVTVASAATLSRARRKVDLAMMIHRRQQWVDIGVASTSIQLSCSSHLSALESESELTCQVGLDKHFIYIRHRHTHSTQVQIG